MKRYLFSFLFSITLFTSFAQVKTDPSKHLSFKGVPIDGTLSEYVSEMGEIGFTHKGTKDGIALLRGDFASYKNCIISVSTLKKKDLVSKITVMFPDCDTWSALSANYFHLKELLTEKYGNPSKCVEKFQSYTPDSDGSKLIDVKLDACKYCTTYETENGTIQLSIEHGVLMDCFVTLVYIDKINSDTIKKQALDDL